MVTWSCPCGVTNSVNRYLCAGCGWTRLKAERHARGESGEADDPKEKQFADKARRNRLVLAVPLLLLMAAAIAAIKWMDHAYGLDLDLGGVVLLCAALARLCWYMIDE